MQTARDPQFGHLAWDGGVDIVGHDDDSCSIMNSQHASNHEYISWIPSECLVPQSAAMDLSYVTNVQGATSWNVEISAARDADSIRPTMCNTSSRIRLIEQAQLIEMYGMMLAPDELSAGLKHPKPSDWTEWQPMIMEVYKHGTARMILKKLQDDGFYVTDKMLRERLRQWRINNKNKRPIRRGSQPAKSGLSSGERRHIPHVRSTMEVEKHVRTSSEDASQRLFLSTIDHYFDHAWASKLQEYEGRGAIILFIRINDAIKIATEFQSKLGWTILHQAGRELQSIDWHRLSPKIIVRLLLTFRSWSRSDDMKDHLYKAVKSCLSSSIGQRHPVVLMMETALHGKLDMQTCERYLAIAQAKAEVKASGPEDMALIYHDLRCTYVRVLYGHRKLKRMEEVLNSWPSTSVLDPYFKMRHLAKAKRCLGDYQETERLCSAAFGVSSKGTSMSGVLTIIRCHVRTLLDQGRPEDAVKVALKSLPPFDQAIKKCTDPRERWIYLEYFRNEANCWREDYQHSECFDTVIEQFNKMSLQL